MPPPIGVPPPGPLRCAGLRRQFPISAGAVVSTLSAMLAPPAFGQQLQPEPGFYFGPALVTAYDSNVTLAQKGYGVSGAQIDTAALLAGFDRNYEREHVYATADVGRVVYRHDSIYEYGPGPQGQLVEQAALPGSLYDFTKEDFLLGLKSTLPADVTTDVSLTRTASLADQAYLNTVRRDVITTNGAKARLEFPLTTYWHGVAIATGAKSRNSDALDRPTDLDTTEFDAGVRYQTGASNYVDVLARTVNASYPHATLAEFSDAPYRERGADLRMKWTISGVSDLAGRIGYLQRRYDTLTLLDFSGPAYDLTYNWHPETKLRLQLYVLRQTGSPGDIQFLDAVTHTYRVTPSYIPTDKTRLEIHYEWTRLDYYGDLQSGTAQSSDRRDTLDNFGLAASWTPRKWAGIKLEVRKMQRGTNAPYLDYTDVLSSLSVRLLF